jgi:MFS transporter, FHS family, glucose/mannose:H+ symporter
VFPGNSTIADRKRPGLQALTVPRGQEKAAAQRQEWAELGDEMRGHVRLLLAGLASFALMGFAQALIGPTLPEARRLFALTQGQATLLITALWVGSALGVAVMYAFGPRVNPRHAVGLLTLGSAALAWQPAWAAMLLGALIFGVGNGMATGLFNPRVLRTYGSRGASMLSLLNAAFAAGAIVAPLIFVAVGGVSRSVFAMTAALCAVVWVLSGEKAGTHAVTIPAGRPGFRIHWPILVFGAVGVGIEASLIGLGPSALITAGATEEQAARLLSAFFVAFLLSRIVLGFMAHRVPSFMLFFAALAFTALSALAAALWAPGPAFVAMGIASGMFFPGFFVTASRKMGEDARVTPVILSAGLVGGIGAPLVLSALTSGLGDRGFFWLLFGIALPVAGLALLAMRGMAR